MRLRAAGDWAGAIAKYREVLRRDPAFLDAYNNLALSLVHEKQYDEAMNCTATQWRLNPIMATAG